MFSAQTLSIVSKARFCSDTGMSCSAVVGAAVAKHVAATALLETLSWAGAARTSAGPIDSGSLTEDELCDCFLGLPITLRFGGFGV